MAHDLTCAGRFRGFSIHPKPGHGQNGRTIARGEVPGPFAGPQVLPLVIARDRHEAARGQVSHAQFLYARNQTYRHKVGR